MWVKHRESNVGKHYEVQVRDRHIEQILKFFCHAEKLHCVFRLFAKMSINNESLFGVDM